MATQAELVAAGLRTLKTQDGALSAVDLGATVLSWSPAGGDDVLFLSRDALVGVGDEIHGGIPLCAPWFGQGRDGATVAAPHGLVRWAPWRLVHQSPSTLVWEVTSAELAHLPGAADYPGDLRYRAEVVMGQGLSLSLTVDSPSEEFVLDDALHCYFAVSDEAPVVIGGLEGEPYRDYDQGGAEQPGAAEPVRVDGPVNRVYQRAGQLTITDAHRTISLATNGAASTILWNPGPDAGRPGLADDEWRRFVCVEVGNVQSGAVTVPAGGSHTLGLEVAVSP